MQIWKLEACPDDERIGCRWGYVVAASEAEAVEMGRKTSGLPVVSAHKMRKEMIWPGAPLETLFWSS